MAGHSVARRSVTGWTEAFSEALDSVSWSEWQTAQTIRAALRWLSPAPLLPPLS